MFARGGGGDFGVSAAAACSGRPRRRGRAGAADRAASPHRRGLLTVQYIAGTGDRRWLRRPHAAMEPHAGGAAHVDYAGFKPRDWRGAHYGDDYERLTWGKCAYAPERPFSSPQPIG